MSDQPTYPIPPAQPPAGSYPVTLTIDAPDRIARWRPLVHWLLLVPHYVVLWAFGILAGIVVIISWFFGVILGRIPSELLELVALYQRYSVRVQAYYFFLHEAYPPFSFDTTFEDTRPDYPTRVDVVPQVEGRSRLTIFFRALLLIPHAIVLWFLTIALMVVVFLGFFAVIVLGRWPAGLRSFVVGYLRWTNRYSGYANLLTDRFPPFSLS